MMAVLRRAQRPLGQPGQLLPRSSGIELARASAQHIVASMAIQPELPAPNGYLHPATLIALADKPGGYGAPASVATAAASCITVELKANSLAAAGDGRLVCHARIRQAKAPPKCGTPRSAAEADWSRRFAARNSSPLRGRLTSPRRTPAELMTPRLTVNLERRRRA